MRILLVFAIAFVLFTGCIEPFDFVVENDQPTMVIESQISNVSYNETRDYPSDGRYFKVTLRRTSNVINVRDEVVSNAAVTLMDDLGMEWAYTESPIGSGQYFLMDDEFKATPEQQYKLAVRVSDIEAYESSWERIPSIPPDMEDIGFEEKEIQKYVFEAGEKVIATIPGAQVGIDLPEKSQMETTFYRWDFEPTWIFEAPLAPTLGPNRVCWVSSENYLSNYELQIDNVGGYTKDLFFLEVPFNDRILSDLSVLVRQFAVSEDYYYFWDELKKQTNRGSIFDAPPYNLRSNFKSMTGEARVSGYFGVVSEQAKRWYINRLDFSYFVEAYLLRICTDPTVRDKGPECFSCLQYSSGTTSNEKPEWWR